MVLNDVQKQYFSKNECFPLNKSNIIYRLKE